MTESLEGIIVEPDYIVGGSNGNLIDYVKGNDAVSAYLEDHSGKPHVRFYAGDPYEYGHAYVPLEAAVHLAQAILAAAARLEARDGWGHAPGPGLSELVP